MKQTSTSLYCIRIFLKSISIDPVGRAVLSLSTLSTEKMSPVKKKPHKRDCLSNYFPSMALEINLAHSTLFPRIVALESHYN